MKTVERSHLPAQLWEKVRLPGNYKQGLEMLEKNLEYWPHYIQKKCGQRLKRLFEYLSKVRKLKLHDKSGALEVYKQKTERREGRREKKAEKIAKLDNSIEKELIARLRSGLYEDIYNVVSKETFEKVVKDELKGESEHEEDIDFEEYIEGESELDLLEGEENEFEEDDEEEEEEEEDIEEDEDFDESDNEIENPSSSLPASKKARHGGGRSQESYVHIEYEQEEEPIRQQFN